MPVTASFPSLLPTTSDTSRRRVLLIAYSFPPVGGAGVQRPAKWTKYLPQFGWDVTVLTPENPSVPLRDESLLAEIPPETRIIHARTWEPDYKLKQQLAGKATTGHPGLLSIGRSFAKSFVKRCVQTALQPDLQVLWVKNAIRAATKELERVPHDAILVTVPPYSMLSIGVSLKQRFGLPVVFDFRDEWDLSSRYLEQASHGWWTRLVQTRMQRRLLKQADAVIATTQASAATYQQKLAEVGNTAQSHCIYNGYDPEDFANLDPGTNRAQSTDRFQLVYTGTLWNLTDIEPLVSAIEQMQHRRPELLDKLELVCVGRKTPEQQAVLDPVNRTNCRTDFVDYCHHKEIAGRLQQADALCLLLSDVPGAERVVPAKVFEYLASRKPILAIAPFGETSRIVQRFLPEGHYAPRDIAGIAAWLIDRLSGSRRVSPRAASTADLTEFSRPHLTGRLAAVLNSVSKRPAAVANQLMEVKPSAMSKERCLVNA